jgi:hypothetical protein
MRPCASFREATAKEQVQKGPFLSPGSHKRQKKVVRRWCSLSMLRFTLPVNCCPSCHTCVRGRVMTCVDKTIIRPSFVSVTHESATRKDYGRGLQTNVLRFAAYCKKKTNKKSATHIAHTHAHAHTHTHVGPKQGRYKNKFRLGLFSLRLRTNGSPSTIAEAFFPVHLRGTAVQPGLRRVVQRFTCCAASRGAIFAARSAAAAIFAIIVPQPASIVRTRCHSARQYIFDFQVAPVIG